MNNLLVTLLVCFFSFSPGICRGKVFIVSDIDDTLKITQGTDLKGVLHFLRDERGVQKDLLVLFREWEARGAEFVYLSSSYKFLYDGVEWLKEADFPDGVVYQRDENSPLDGRVYKKNLLRMILRTLRPGPEDSIYFFGDNGGADDEVYSEVVSEEKLQNQSMIFVRDVLLSQSVPFVEARDVAYKSVNYFISAKDMAPNCFLWLISGNFSFEAYVLLHMPYYSRNSLTAFQKENLIKRLKRNCRKDDLSCSGRVNKLAHDYFRTYYQF